MMRLSSTRRRAQTGATTAEYVGIVAFVSLLVVTLAVLVPGTSDSAGGVVRKAFCTIGTPLGFASCSNEDLPGYVPTNCTVSSHEGRGGGSITVLAEVTGESGYTLTRNRERQDDGSFEDRYTVRTMGQLGGGYEFSLGGGVEANTGSGSASAKASGSAKIEGDVTWGSEFSFDTESEATDFIDRFKDNFGEFGGDVDGSPEPTSTYYELGGKGTISGEAGPLSGEVAQGVVLGLETFPKTGEKKVKMALTVDGALRLGLPLPESVLKLAAEGKVSAAVIADVVFDKDGNVARLGGNLTFTPTGTAGVELNTDWAEPGTGRHRKDPPNELTGLELPQLASLDFGRNYTLSFSTDFQRADGSYDYGAIDALSSELAGFITGGEGMSSEQAQALAEQINQHSEVTFNEYDYNEQETKYGASAKVLFIKVGAEGHLVTVDQSLLGGYYYDPVQGLWAENIVCQS
jgi:Flp pilus assembly pilin Flp